MSNRWSALKLRVALIICVAVSSVAAAACARSSSSPAETSALQDVTRGDSSGKVPGPATDRSNIWGGEHLELVRTDSGATLQYDCAHGTMSAPPTPDASGRFVVTGTHVLEHGGPVRADEVEDRRAATYTGRVAGGSMTLSVQVSGVSATLGPFTLRRGDAGRLYRCY
jgi:hypothetical protein